MKSLLAVAPFLALAPYAQSQSFGSQGVITTAADAAYSVYATDLDGDGDADVLSASYIDDKIAWYENLGGGAFGPQQVITTAADAAHSVYATDLDGDGDTDVLSASGNDDKVAWYENLGGGAFGAQQVITTAADGAESVYATDLDGDGDADVLSASDRDDKIAWYENLGGGAFGPQQVITTAASGAWSVYATDLDEDGDADVLSAAYLDDKIAWYENLGGGAFGAQQVITTAADGAASVYATDLDGDGGADVLSASVNDDKIARYRNLMVLDCNSNGIADLTDIASGTSQDCNTNGIPDECDIASGFSIDIDADGQLDDCVAPPLMADTYAMSLASGGTQSFSLSTPPLASAVSLYVLLGTISGTAPGVPVGSFTVPLNPDAYLIRTFNFPSTPPLGNSIGIMSPASSGGGQASATFSLPPALAPTLVGLTVHHAFVSVDLQTGNVNFVSNAVPLALLP
jgi:hypothetical protein